ncbi:hypothetical protein [Citrobacter telavivensis]
MTTYYSRSSGLTIIADSSEVHELWAGLYEAKQALKGMKELVG